MVQGEFVFTYRLVCKLKGNGNRIVSARSERVCQEFKDKNDVIHKHSIFEFIDFVDC